MYMLHAYTYSYVDKSICSKCIQFMYVHMSVYARSNTQNRRWTKEPFKGHVFRKVQADLGNMLAANFSLSVRRLQDSTSFNPAGAR